MFEFFRNFKNRKLERKMADRYDQILKILPKAIKFNDMVIIRKEIVAFKEKYGESALSEHLYEQFDDRLKFVIQYQKRKNHGPKRNAREDSWQTKKDF